MENGLLCVSSYTVYEKILINNYVMLLLQIDVYNHKEQNGGIFTEIIELGYKDNYNNSRKSI